MNLKRSEKITAIALTMVQYSGLAFFLLWADWLARPGLLRVIEFVGIAAGMLAIINMMQGKLRIDPVPAESAVLIQKGLYAFIRHPMYLSLLLTFTPIVVSASDPILYAAFGVFTINLFLKMLFEEKLLLRKFTNYAAYSQKTWRLIPLVF